MILNYWSSYMPNFLEDVSKQLNKTDFNKEFLGIFVRNGFGALPKLHIPGYPPTYSDNIRPFVPGYPPSFDALP